MRRGAITKNKTNPSPASLHELVQFYMLMVLRALFPESAISLDLCFSGFQALEELNFMITVKSSILFLTFQAGGTNLRHSPDLAGRIASSLRSGVVLPANRLLRPLPDTCDSAIDGPFCSRVSDNKRARSRRGAIRRLSGSESPWSLQRPSNIDEKLSMQTRSNAISRTYG
jgi:hypothetical protein